ncbi:MAG: hypothetical protein AAF380_01820, partial [Bacteroidota bacterium]
HCRFAWETAFDVIIEKFSPQCDCENCKAYNQIEYVFSKNNQSGVQYKKEELETFQKVEKALNTYFNMQKRAALMAGIKAAKEKANRDRHEDIHTVNHYAKSETFLKYNISHPENDRFPGCAQTELDEQIMHETFLKSCFSLAFEDVKRDLGYNTSNLKNTKHTNYEVNTKNLREEVIDMLTVIFIRAYEEKHGKKNKEEKQEIARSIIPTIAPLVMTHQFTLFDHQDFSDINDDEKMLVTQAEYFRNQIFPYKFDLMDECNDTTPNNMIQKSNLELESEKNQILWLY